MPIARMRLDQRIKEYVRGPVVECGRELKRSNLMLLHVRSELLGGLWSEKLGSTRCRHFDWLVS